MPDCRKCGKPLADDWVVCPWCSTSVAIKPRNVKSRGNGQGTAYRRGKTWTAKVILRYDHYTDENGVEKDKAVPKTKGGFKTKTEALQYCEVMRKSPNKVESTETLLQIYERWRTFYESRIKDTTMACYKAAFKYFEPIQHYKMVTISPDDIQGCMDKCNKGRSTKDDMKTVCSLIFKYAMQNGIVEVNQAQFLYVGKEQKGTRPPFSRAELTAIEKAVSKHQYADYVFIMCYTGFRPNEFLSMKKKDAYLTVDIEGEETPILEGGFKTKAGTNRWVILHPKIQSLVSELMKIDSEYLFPNKEDGTMMNDEYFRKKCFYPLMNELGISGKVPYSCRHTFSNFLKLVEGSDIDKARLMGHTEAAMTRRYQSADLISMKSIIYSI